MNKILFLMVRSFNKWLRLALLFAFPALFLSFSAKKQQFPIPAVDHLHPVHISTTEINHNATDNTLEISCRVFIDDFELCLGKLYKTKADLSAASMKKEMDSLVKKYLSGHLQIKTDGKEVKLNYLGFEKENEAAYAYFEVSNITTVKKVDINNSILHDLYDDQISIIHVIVGGTRKSTKLDFPTKEAEFIFSR